MKNSIVEKIFKITSSKISEKKGKEILKLSEKIINDFSTKNKSSLLIGKIQSGKTTGFINVIARALETNFKNIIILTGTKNDLNDQTYERIKPLFSGEDIYDEQTSDNVFKINVWKMDNSIDSYAIKSKNYKNIIIGKKGASTKKILKHINENDKFLIIDDESDHASNDTNKTNKNKPEKSTTNKILSDVSKKENVFYLAVTATPQSHALMSEGDFNLPTKIYFIKPGEGYKGIIDFFEETSPLIRPIPLWEANSIKSNDAWTTDLNIFSIKNAIIEFLVKVWGLKNGKILGDDIDEKQQIFENFNFLVNIDLKNVVHEKTKIYICDYLVDLEKNKAELIHELTKGFVQEIFSSLKIQENIEIIAENIQEIIKKYIKVVVLNKDSIKKEIPKTTSNIIIGGHSLSRGLTIKNLIISFFLQDPKIHLAPTTLQRARWFGYRERYFKYTRLYASKNIISIFKEMLSVEKILWEYAESNYNHTVIGLKEAFSHYQTVKPVAPNIAKYKIVNAGINKIDSNFGDVSNQYHENAFKWFNDKVAKKLKNIEKKQYGIREKIYNIQELLGSIDKSLNKEYKINEYPVILYVKDILEQSLKNGFKQIRILGFFIKKKGIFYRGQQSGWDISKRYVESGSIKNSKLKDSEYSLNKRNKNIPDLQFHPILNPDKKYLFFAYYENIQKQILELLSE